MDIRTIVMSPLEWSGDLLGLGFFQDQTELGEELTLLDDRLGGVLQELIGETEFTGKPGSNSVTRVGGDIRKLALVGLGPVGRVTADSYRRAAAALAKTARQQKCKTLALALPVEDIAAGVAVQAMVEGIHLALHQDQRFKSEPEDKGPALERVDILGIEGQAEAVAQAQAVASGVILARELVAAPASVVTPITLAETAVQLAHTYGLEAEILEREACEALGMGAFLGVAQASDLPPKFIHLTYRPAGTPVSKLAIVGKGLTFDSGGLNIKAGPGSSIEMMKMDMGGAAATLGAAQVIGQLRPAAEVHFIIAATENMISGRALHPGDILKAANGKTIEVNNTDAEGRLTLADALVFAEKLGVDAIVDLATLTGACVIALGDDMAGLWSTDDGLAAGLQQAAQGAGEKVWRMPLEDKYFEGLKSSIADMKNTGPRGGGSITAALFLKQYVDKTPWAHLDIAGPVWSDKGDTLASPGATGYGVRTLVNWILAQKPAAEG